VGIKVLQLALLTFAVITDTDAIVFCSFLWQITKMETDRLLPLFSFDAFVFLCASFFPFPFFSRFNVLIQSVLLIGSHDHDWGFEAELHEVNNLPSSKHVPSSLLVSPGQATMVANVLKIVQGEQVVLIIDTQREKRTNGATRERCARCTTGGARRAPGCLNEVHAADIACNYTSRAAVACTVCLR